MKREMWLQRTFFSVHSYAAILASIAVVLHLLAANYHWRKWHEL